MNIKNLIFIFLISSFASAQIGTIRGFIYEKDSEEPIIYCNVYLSGTDIGTVSDDNGYFILTNVPYGTYTLKASFIGFSENQIDIILDKNKRVVTTKLFLSTKSLTLDNINLNVEREEQKKQVNTGVIKLTTKSINRLPSIGGEPDIAQFLQVLPGVIFTGDQGGQLYIRGGAPIHNKVLLDGMTIYSPFHSIGFFSVFDTDIIKKADVYTGCFGAQYGGRISSIMDIKTRDGNKKRVTGKLSANSFSGKILVEGPILKSEKNEISNSFILSAKSSYLDKTSKYFYQYVDTDGLPYSFSDVYGKFSFFSKNGSKFNVHGFNFNDAVDYTDLTSLGWKNYGFGSNLVLVPSSAKMLVEGKLSYSNYHLTQQDAGEDVNDSQIDGFNVGLDFLYFISKKHEMKYGVEVLGYTTELSFRNSISALIEEQDHSTEFAGYILYKFNDNNRFIAEPSIRLQSYTSLGENSFEPRFGFKYNVNEKIRLKASLGKFSQNLMSTSSERDVVNLFSGYLSSTTSLPETFLSEDVETSLQKSTHYIVGLEYQIGLNLDINLEGYIKNFSQLIAENKNQVYDDTPEFEVEEDYLKKDFIVERGCASGLDLLIKYADKRINIWSVYSFGIIEREDEIQLYSPHYDRRHNFNFVFNYLIDRKKTWEFGLRWNFGSGFPFTKTQAYYEELNLNNNLNQNFEFSNGNLGILYSDLNTGRLPSYHRLDISLKKKFSFSKFNELEISTGLTNVYNRKNIFYYNRVDAIRVNQLPIIPSLGVSWKF